MSAPVADFSFTPAHGLSPCSVQFTDLSANAPTSWSWVIDSGGVQGQKTSTDQNPVIVLPVGRWAVSLTVTNDDGSSTKSIPNLEGPFVTSGH